MDRARRVFVGLKADFAPDEPGARGTSCVALCVSGLPPSEIGRTTEATREGHEGRREPRLSKTYLSAARAQVVAVGDAAKIREELAPFVTAGDPATSRDPLGHPAKDQPVHGEKGVPVGASGRPSGWNSAVCRSRSSPSRGYRPRK